MPNFEESCGAPTTGPIFIIAGWKIIRRPPYGHSEYAKREKLLPVLEMVARYAARPYCSDQSGYVKSDLRDQ
jgi:hypothetical protein